MLFYNHKCPRQLRQSDLMKRVLTVGKDKVCNNAPSICEYAKFVSRDTNSRAKLEYHLFSNVGFVSQILSDSCSIQNNGSGH